MIFCVTKKDGIIISKEVFDGDDNKNLSFIEERKISEPSFEFSICEKKEFDSSEIALIRNDDQKAWDLLKGNASEIENLLAKVLGLG